MGHHSKPVCMCVVQVAVIKLDNNDVASTSVFWTIKNLLNAAFWLLFSWAQDSIAHLLDLAQNLAILVDILLFILYLNNLDYITHTQNWVCCLFLH